MRTGNKAWSTRLAVTAHVSKSCCVFDMQTTMDFDSILLDVLRSRGQERFKIKRKQKDALQKIVLDSQDCLIVLPTGYGKSLIYQLLPSLFDRVSKESSKDKAIVLSVISCVTTIPNIFVVTAARVTLQAVHFFWAHPL